MREVPRKNYLTLFVIVALTVVITFILASFYNNRHRHTSILYNFVSEVTPDDIYIYLSENPTSVIYINDKYDIDRNSFEQHLKDKIVELNMFDYIIYLDSNNIDDGFIKKFNKKYGDVLIKKYPVLIVFEDGKISEVYNESDIKKFKLGDIK